MYWNSAGPIKNHFSYWSIWCKVMVTMTFVNLVSVLDFTQGEVCFLFMFCFFVIKVKNMSETLWQEHQPSLLRLQESFSHKLQNLRKKFQDKVASKMNKLYRRFKKHAWKDSGRTANTKRREYSGHGRLYILSIN